MRVKRRVALLRFLGHEIPIHRPILAKGGEFARAVRIA